MTLTLTLERPADWSVEQLTTEARFAARARNHLLPFCQWMNPYYTTAPHLELLAAELEAIERGDNDRLIVEMPPRHGKSEMSSKNFPAWYLARNPRRSVISASYGAELGHEFGRGARNILRDPRCNEIFPGISVADDSGSAHRWHTNEGGYLIASGIPGPITGRGAHLLNIDDPIKSRAEAESEAFRAGVYRWYRADARTRLEPEGAVVLTTTRWHEDDLAGRLKAEQPGRWRVITLPAIAEEGDPLGRPVGAALWPDRYDETALLETQGEVGDAEWSALYQQHPAPSEGAIFKWFPTYGREEPVPDIILMPIDTAVTASERSDFWAWSFWGVRGDKIDLLYAEHLRADPPTAEERIFYSFGEIMQQFPQTRIAPLIRKSVAIDRVAASHLQNRRIPVTEYPLPAGGNTKTGLANLIVDYFQSGMARIPGWSPPWLEPWMAEHKSFPHAAHDDLVENTILALHYFREMVFKLPDVRWTTNKMSTGRR